MERFPGRGLGKTRLARPRPVPGPLDPDVKDFSADWCRSFPLYRGLESPVCRVSCGSFRWWLRPTYAGQKTTKTTSTTARRRGPPAMGGAGAAAHRRRRGATGSGAVKVKELVCR